MTREIRQLARRYWGDVVLATVLGVLAAVSSFYLAQRIDPVLFHPVAEDVWFQSDLPRIFANMTSRGSDHYP